MAKFQPRPQRQQKLLSEDGNISRQWDAWFAKVENQLSALGYAVVPANSAIGVVPPSFTADANFLYVATGPNSWKRIPLLAF